MLHVAPDASSSLDLAGVSKVSKLTGDLLVKRPSTSETGRQRRGSVSWVLTRTPIYSHSIEPRSRAPFECVWALEWVDWTEWAASILADDDRVGLRASAPSRGDRAMKTLLDCGMGGHVCACH